MTCTGACLGERGLVAIDKRTDRKQKEPRRALSPTLQRPSCKTCANVDAEGLAPAERRKRSPSGFGVCTGPARGLLQCTHLSDCGAPVRCRGYARAFARCKLIFSE